MKKHFNLIISQKSRNSKTPFSDSLMNSNKKCNGLKNSMKHWLCCSRKMTISLVNLPVPGHKWLRKTKIIPPMWTTYETSSDKLKTCTMPTLNIWKMKWAHWAGNLLSWDTIDSKVAVVNLVGLLYKTAAQQQKDYNKRWDWGTSVYNS